MLGKDREDTTTELESQGAETARPHRVLGRTMYPRHVPAPLRAGPAGDDPTTVLRLAEPHQGVGVVRHAVERELVTDIIECDVHTLNITSY